MNRTETILNDIVQEFDRASLKFPQFASAHEGYAILKEEVDELWDVIKAHKSGSDIVCLCGSGRFKEAFEQAEFDETLERRIRMRAEAIQVAAMALRFVYDICEKEGS